MTIPVQDFLSLQGSQNKGSWLTVEELFRESFERAGISAASLTADLISGAIQTANFMLNSWCSRYPFSWMRSSHFFDLQGGQDSYPVVEGLRNLESVVLTQMAVLPAPETMWRLVQSPNMVASADEIRGLFTQARDHVVSLESVTDDPVTFLGWTQDFPVKCSCIGIVPETDGQVISFFVQALLTPGGAWTTVGYVSPRMFHVKHTGWIMVDNAPLAFGWRLVFHERTLGQNSNIQNLVPVTRPAGLRHIWFGALGGGGGSGIQSGGAQVYAVRGTPAGDGAGRMNGDRVLGEIAYTDWMALSSKNQTSYQPTSYVLNNGKKPFVCIWPVLPEQVLGTRLRAGQEIVPAWITGVLYTAYLAPRDISALFQLLDVPAVAVDALAAELAYRIAMKTGGGQDQRIALLAQEAGRSFAMAMEADGQSSSTSLRIDPDFQTFGVR